MLVSMKELLDHANEYNYAVMAPNIFYELDARSCICAAEEMNAPLILDVEFGSHPDIITQGWQRSIRITERILPMRLRQSVQGTHPLWRTGRSFHMKRMPRR